MKKAIFTLMVIALAVTPALSAPSIYFTPGGSSPGAWEYDGSGSFSFSQQVVIDQIGGDTGDSLVGNYVYVPDLLVSGKAGGPYGLTATGAIEFKDSSGTVLMSGTLGQGDLIPVGTIGATYTELKMDITNITVNNIIGSDALALVTPYSGMDFSLSIIGNMYISDMLETGIADSGTFGGTMTVQTEQLPHTPAPAAVLLGSLGVAMVGWLRRRKMF